MALMRKGWAGGLPFYSACYLNSGKQQGFPAIREKTRNFSGDKFEKP